MINPHVTRYPVQTIAQLARHVETPFFLYEEETIRSHCRAFKDAFTPLFPGFTPLYAVKANPNPHVLRVILSEGFGLDCSSLSEVHLAQTLGAAGMHTGNYVTERELRAALVSSLLLNLDDVSMLPTVQKIGLPEFLSFRINPGIGSSTLASNVLAGPDAKYGVPNEHAVAAYRHARDAGVKRFGIHMMTGSNVPSEDYFSGVTRRLLIIAGTIKKALDIDFECINIGGGFNVPYHPEEPTFDLGVIAKGIRRVFDEEVPRMGLREPTLMIEPGRRVTCDAGFLVGRVQVIKDGYKRFIGIDASCSDMPRPQIYDAYHHISVLGKEQSDKREMVNVVGSICENSDQFAKDRLLPPISVGDCIVIHNCGAHAYAMGHNYNGKLRSAEYLLQTGGIVKKIRRAETVDDLLVTIIDGESFSLPSSL